MTPEERAEARRLVDESNLWSDTSVEWADFASQAKRIVPKLLDALEAAERERDEATARLRKHCLDESCCDGSDVVPDLVAERDTARAQVAMLAAALREIAEDAGPSAECTIAQAALKATGIET